MGWGEGRGGGRGELRVCVGGGVDVRLGTMCLSISTQRKLRHSTGALDDQTTVGHQGLKKIAARQALDVRMDGARKKTEKKTKKTLSPP